MNIFGKIMIVIFFTLVLIYYTSVYTLLLVKNFKYQVYFNEFNNNYEVHLDIFGQDLVYVVNDIKYIN